MQHNRPLVVSAEFRGGARLIVRIWRAQSVVPKHGHAPMGERGMALRRPAARGK
jgi:hypothetical protein